MSSKSLPEYLRFVLESHVQQSQLTHDKELEDIYQRLTRLNDTVDQMKQRILRNRQESQTK